MQIHINKIIQVLVEKSLKLFLKQWSEIMLLAFFFCMTATLNMFIILLFYLNIRFGRRVKKRR